MTKTKFFATTALFSTFILLLFACDKKVGKLPQAPVNPPVTAAFCDSITYTKHIKPIITANCATAGCHSSGSSFGDYSSFGGIQTKVNSGAFANRVFNKDNPMPASGLLPQAQRDVIKCWLDKGAPNN